MPGRRVPIQKIESLLRLHFGEDYSIRRAAKYSRLSFSTARSYVTRAKQAGLGWPLPEGMTDAQLSAKLFPDVAASKLRHPEPDWEAIYDMLTYEGQTLQVAHERYLQTHPGGYGYGQFCALYRAWCNEINMIRQAHSRKKNSL